MIVLESFTKADFQRLISWIDDKEELTKFAGTSFRYPLTEDQLERYVSDENKTIFRVKETKRGKVIGHAEIFQVEEKKVRLCRVLIGEKDFRGKGLGQEIIKELTRLAFESPEIEIVELNVYERNLTARKCYESVGFRRNSTEDKVTRIEGQDWKSLNMMIVRGKREHK